MRAKFGSILDASATDENCEFRFVARLVRRVCNEPYQALVGSVAVTNPTKRPERKATTKRFPSTTRSWQTSLSAAALLTPEASAWLIKLRGAGGRDMLRYNKRMVG